MKDLITITVTDASGETGTVEATTGHPFWAPDTGEWVDAGDLRPGQWLQTSSGTWVLVTAVDYDHREQTVHNLTIDSVHTYNVYAGDTNLLTHNCAGSAAQPGRDALGWFTSSAGGESAATAIGRRVHETYSQLFGDGVRTNSAIPGTRLRPDAIDYTNLIVRELKPDSVSGISRGMRQLREYVAAIDPTGTGGWTGVLDLYKP